MERSMIKTYMPELFLSHQDATTVALHLMPSKAAIQYERLMGNYKSSLIKTVPHCWTENQRHHMFTCKRAVRRLSCICTNMAPRQPRWRSRQLRISWGI
jgi:hypothetical protein